LISISTEEMRRFIAYMVFVAMALLATKAEAQTIALGERTPRIKKVKWLDGVVPQKCDFTYIEFIHSASAPCRQSAERIYGIVSEFDNISFVLISHQNATEIDHWVIKYIGKKSGIIINDQQIRTAFGVNYAPYAVILDHKHRALWFGNPRLLNRAAIEKLTENGKRKTENFEFFGFRLE